MSWSVRSLMPDHPVVEITASGIVTAADGQQMMLAVLPLATDHGLVRILYDATDLVRVPTAGEIAEFAEDIVDAPLPHGFRHAHIRPVDLHAAMWVDHWVAVARNRGIAADVFRDRQSALSWLLSPS